MGETNIESIQKDLDKYASLDALANQEGGKLLVDSLSKDIFHSIEVLCASYKKLTHAEFISHCATMSANMDLLKTLTRSGKNKDLAKKALDALMKE